VTAGAAGQSALLCRVVPVPTKNPGQRRLVAESVTFGLGYTAVLIWSGSALVASFTDGEAGPYWPDIPHLRTDTLGVISFGIAIVTLSVSRYLQLRRQASEPPAARPALRAPGVVAVQALADTGVVLGTALVVYLSLNAFTHPVTLRLQLTHLWPWPSEGTVRVTGLAIVLVATIIRRYLKATATRPVSELSSGHKHQPAVMASTALKNGSAPELRSANDRALPRRARFPGPVRSGAAGRRDPRPGGHPG
jgi:hypothetical protein